MACSVFRTLRMLQEFLAGPLEACSVERMSPLTARERFSKKKVISPTERTRGLRNCRKVRQANRAVCPLDAPGCRKIGSQGRFSQMGGAARVGGKGAPTAQPTAKNFALKDPLKSDVCLMASEKSCDCRIEAPMKTRLGVVMLALTLITSTGRAKISQEAL